MNHVGFRDELLQGGAGFLARHEIWKQGRPDRSRERLWRQARKALPDWPGFARCVMSTGLRRAIRSAENQHLDFFRTLSEWADSVEVSPTGFKATKKLVSRAFVKAAPLTLW